MFNQSIRRKNAKNKRKKKEKKKQECSESFYVLLTENKIFDSEGYQLVPARPSGKGRLKTR
jgi:hypothetical protein